MIAMFQTMGLFAGGDPTKALFNVLRPFEDFFADEIPDIASLVLGLTKTAAIATGFVRRQTILQNSNLNVEQYEQVIGELVSRDFLLPVLSLMWCPEHGKYPRTLFIAGHSALPQKVNCDLCRRVMKSGTYLVPSSAAMTLCRRYDGALPALMAWDLERNEIPWNANVYLEGEDDTEKDMVFGKQKSGFSIVECKTYYSDRNDRVRKDNLTGLLHQLEQHVEKYFARGIPLREAILATNYPASDDLVKFIEQTVSEKAALSELKKVRVRLVGPGKMAGWWKA